MKHNRPLAGEGAGSPACDRGGGGAAPVLSGNVRADTKALDTTMPIPQRRIPYAG